jgi:glycosyltransferase involved in cell wall biosynthesis
MAFDVLLVFPHRATFIDRDEALLRERFAVEAFKYDDWQHLFPLLSRIARCQVAVAWFSLGYAYPMVHLGRVLGKPVVLIAGGWDVEAMPEFDYGAMILAKRRRRNAYALAHASRVLAVSNFTKGRVERWAPRARVEVLYHGFPLPPNGIAIGKRGALTVARVSPATWRLKGLDVFMGAARRLPEVPFTLVGDLSAAGDLLDGRPRNVRTTGLLTPAQLALEYARASVYVQLSAVESFGCSLAEAMLSGCVPVVTDRGALPEVVGPVGEQVPYGDVNAATEGIQKALESTDASAAQARIHSHFSIERRARGLVGTIETLLAGGS